ncbi:16S rRNA (guanine(527)-N(7))-methyltransferase RsmG [Rhizomonospora bruguierae]|uniref:16S rRNA (guanine(527)-N(7))-methyltransferase RsmG n=1 Tax=Rhizomonospora bruguierae TaxID=1581705 RepID=UPI0035E45481
MRPDLAESGPLPEGLVVPSLPEGQLLDAARVVFGDRLPLAHAYADLLATDGVIRGLIGPRETPRLWGRHLLNCAVVGELIPQDASVIDVGSGAGLPGIVLAVARPDLTVTLVEPLARRAAFLTEAVATLDLAGTVTVLRARAEELVGTALAPADIVTARAVAPLDRLAAWCLPLAAPGGRLLALKGAAAVDEVAQHRAAVDRLGGGAPVVRQCGATLVEPLTTVVDIVRERAVAPTGPQARTGRAGRRSSPDGGGVRGRPRRR